MSNTTAPAAHPLTFPIDADAVTPLAGPGFTFTLVRNITDVDAIAAEAAMLAADRHAITLAAAAL